MMMKPLRNWLTAPIIGLPWTTMILTAMLALPALGQAPAPEVPNPPDVGPTVSANPILSWQYSPNNIIQNGGFESGTQDPWIIQNNGFGGADIGDGTGFFNEPETPPLEGSFSVTFQGVNPQFVGPASFTIRQIVTIPTTASEVALRWSDRISNYAQDGVFQTSNPPHAFRLVILNEAGNSVLGIPFATENGDPPFTAWNKRKVDLSDYKGETIQILFLVEVGLDWFYVHLDNIRMEVNQTGTFTNDVFLSKLPSVDVSTFIGSTTNQYFELEDLEPDTDYFWRIVPKFEGSSTVGPVWNFRTTSMGSVNHFEWSPITGTPRSEDPILVSLKAKDQNGFTVTNFNDTVNLSASETSVGASTHNLLLDQPFTALSGFDRSTIGYSFTPDQDLWVTEVRAFSGDKVSIWTDAGALLRSQDIPNTPETWVNTPLSQPLLLLAGQTYRIGVFGDGAIIHYARFDAPPSFAHGSINQSYEVSGDGFPSVPHPAQWWYVDLVYSIPTQNSLAIDPATTGVFVNGVWSGETTLTSPPASQVILRAEAIGGATGTSAPFELAMALPDSDGDGMPDDYELANGFNPSDPSDADEDFDDDGQSNVSEYESGNDPTDPNNTLKILAITHTSGNVSLQFTAIADRSYTVQYSDSLNPVNWQKLSDVNPAPADQSVQIPDSTSGGQIRYYRLVTPMTP